MVYINRLLMCVIFIHKLELCVNANVRAEST